MDEVHSLAHFIEKGELARPTTDADAGRTIRSIGLCSINREEWIITDLAANLCSVTTVPLYEVLGDETLEIILE